MRANSANAYLTLACEYGWMTEVQRADYSAEMTCSALREELARADAMLASAGPILRHMLVREETLFGDHIIAHVRGMAAHIARQLVLALGNDTGRLFDPLLQELFEDAHIPCHLHALVMEMQVADQLSQRSGPDLVLTPMLKQLAAASDPNLAGLAMATITAQARHVQQMRRMELPLCELPGSLFHRALRALGAICADHPALESADQQLRGAYVEGNSRIALLARLVAALEPDSLRVLDLSEAGLAIFITAFAARSGQSRETVALSLHDRQVARLIVGCRAAGLERSQAQSQLQLLHPAMPLPDGFDALRVDQARDYLCGAVKPLCAMEG